MIRLIRSIILILTLVALCGCASLIQKPHITVISTNVVSIDTAGFDIELLLGVENPNPFDITLLGYTYDLQVMSVPFSSGGHQNGTSFHSGQRTDIRLPFRVLHSDLLGILKRRPDLDRVPYSVDARLDIATPLGELVIPLKKTDTISVPAAYRPGAYLKRFLQPLKDKL